MSSNRQPPSRRTVTTSSTQSSGQSPAYTPSTAVRTSSCLGLNASINSTTTSTPSNTRTTHRDPQALAATNLNLSRSTILPPSHTQPPSLSTRQTQRPWTPREFAFISHHIPATIPPWELSKVKFEFKERFKWTPSEGQLRSQWWYFKMGTEELAVFLARYEKYEEGRSGVRRSEEEVLGRLKGMTLRPSW